MARCLDAKGGDASLLAKKMKDAIAEIKKREQRRKEKEAMAAARKAEEEVEEGIHQDISPPAIDISTDEDDSEEEGVDEPLCTSASEEPVGDHKCPVCEKDFGRKETLNRHKKDLHTVVEGRVPCTRKYCKKDFDTKYEMIIHRDGTDGKDGCKYKCPSCPFETKCSRNGKIEAHKKKCMRYFETLAQIYWTK